MDTADGSTIFAVDLGDQLRADDQFVRQAVTLSWTPTGTLVVGGLSGTFEVDPTNGEVLRALYDAPMFGLGHSRSYVSHLSFNDAEDTLFVGAGRYQNDPGDIKKVGAAFSWPEGDLLWERHTSLSGDVNSAVWLKDEDRLLIEGLDETADRVVTLEVLDGRTGEVDLVPPLLGGQLKDVAYSADGTKLLLIDGSPGSAARGISVREAATGNPLWTNTDAGWAIWLDGDVVVSTNDGTQTVLQWLEPATGALLREVYLDVYEQAGPFAVEPQGQDAYFGGLVYDLDTGAAVHGPLTNCAVSYPFTWLSNGWLAGNGSVCEYWTNTERKSMPAGQMTVSGDHLLLAVASGNTITVAETVGTGSWTHTFDEDVECLALNPSGNQLLVHIDKGEGSSSRRQLSIIDPRTGIERAFFETAFAGDVCSALDWHPSAPVAAIADLRDLRAIDTTHSP